jgi:radical SAM superfamily enzyme YgiQ (UPF0313 family)
MEAEQDRCRVALIEAGSPGLNIYTGTAMGRGAPLLATVVRDAGYGVRAFIEDVSGRDSIDWDYVAACDVVGFSAITCTLPRTRDLLQQARAVNPRATIVLGGPEPTCAPERSLDIGADFVLRGEAELTFPRLLAVLSGRSRERLAEIPGLVWRAEAATREGPPPRQLTRTELDALPLVDHTLVHEWDRADVASVWRARGCPQHCDFCEVCRIWPRHTARSNDRALSELIAAQDAGFGTAFLIDDNAAADKRTFMDFLKAAADRGFARILVMQVRADSVFTKGDRIDREYLRLLKRAAAVTVVCVGVESASDEALARVHKKTDATRTARALRAMRRQGLVVHGMFIAFAEDTGEVIRRNGDFARRFVSSLQFLFETPLPGTKRTAEHQARGALLFQSLDELRFFDGMHVAIRPQNMPASKMQEQVERVYRRFYSLPRIVAAALRGAFGRFRRLSDAQRTQLARLPVRERIASWAWLHVQYKFAPASFLAQGRSRLRAFMRDPEYRTYLEMLRGL